MSERTNELTWGAAYGSTLSRPAAPERAIARLKEVKMNWREYLPILSMSLPTILVVFAAVITISMGA